MDLRPIIPFEPISTDILPTGKNWAFQIKWDGTRVLVYYNGVNTRLFNRKLNERTLQYPELTDLPSYCLATSVILDGEVIALENGKPSFHSVMKRDHLKNMKKIECLKMEIPISYMVFDILFYQGEWITHNSLKDRQSLLESIIKPNQHVQLVPNYGDAIQLWETVKKFELEGIVCKDLNSSYRIHAKDNRWQKRKLIRDLVAVVGGVTFRANMVNSLLLGLYDSEERLWYIGHAGTGRLTQEDWRNITQKTKTLNIEKMPFVNMPERNKNTMWVMPLITVKINFLEWTKNKTLRQPSIQSFMDTNPQECKFPD